MAFFLAFFGWFGIAPMMAIVRDDLGLTKTQVGNTGIASVLITIVARLLIGWLCDRIGPRRAYAGLLMVGSVPVMTIGWPTATRRSCCFAWESTSLERPLSSRSTTRR